MNKRGTGAVVLRRYNHEPNYCTRALALLLKKKAAADKEKAGVTSTGDEEKGFQHDLPAPRILHH